MSSDDEEVLALAKQYDVDSLPRDPALAGDTATLAEVIPHILEHYGNPPEFCLLLATSPLRTAKDILGAYDVFRRGSCDTVMSVTRYSHPPQHAIGFDGDFIAAWRPDDMAQQSQRLNELAYHDGSIIMTHTAHFLRTRDWYAGKVKPYFVRGGDVNTPEDLAAVELLMVAQRYLRGMGM